MLGTLFGKHNSDPIKVTASSLGSCEDKNQYIILYCQHYNASSTQRRRILKSPLSSLVGPTVHTNPSRKRSFRRHLSNRRNLKSSASRFRVDRKYFEHRAFGLRWHHENRVIFLTEFSTNTNPTSPAIFAFLNSCSVVCTKNIHWMRFQSEISVFTFLRRS